MRRFPILLGITGLLAIAPPASSQEAKVTHDYAIVNGVKLHYAHQGSGPLILFLHGFPEFWYAWKDQLAEFGKDHFAVAPDMRGYNLSEKPTLLDQYRVSIIVEDIRALADRLRGGQRFVLVGHDWGGVIAWAFAAAHPDLLSHLVIINAPHPTVFQRELDQNPAQQQASQYMILFRSAQAESVLSANSYRPLVGMFSEQRKAGKVTDADIEAYLAAWSQPGALTGGLNYYRASRVSPPVGGQRDSLIGGVAGQSGTIKVPTLVIWGEKDTALLTGNLEGLDRLVPDLRIERVPNGTHWVVHEEPELVNRLIRQAIRR